MQIYMVKIVHAYGLGEGFIWIRVNQAKQQLSVKWTGGVICENITHII